MGETRGRKERVGIVVSDRMIKTVVVRTERIIRHRLYNRLLRRTRRYKVHDEKNEAHVGDKVRIVETRPMSKEKRWRVVEIIERAREAPQRLEE